MRKKMGYNVFFIYAFIGIVLCVGITYAVNNSSLLINTTTALVAVDESAYGSTTFDASELDFKPILDNTVGTSVSESNVVEIDFSVGGSSDNNNDTIIYDIALNDLEVGCSLLSPYIKWKLVSNSGVALDSDDTPNELNGSLDYRFDTIKDGRLVLTTIQLDLPDYSATQEGYHDYTFYMWFSDSCQNSDISTCLNSADQSALFGQNLSGKIEVELYTEGKKALVRDPENNLVNSYCIDKYVVKLDSMGGTVADDSISVISNSAYGSLETLPIPTRSDALITFDTDGGSNIVTTSVSDLVNHSKMSLLATSAANTVSVSYTFDGWYTDLNFTNKVTDVSIVELNTNHTLYAKWIADNNGVITLPSVTKTGYVFAGWYSDRNRENKVGNAGDQYTIVASATLYARWSTIYTVSFNPNGGDVSIPSKEVMYGSAYGDLPTPSKSYTVTYDANGTGVTLDATSFTNNYTFDGWYTNVSGGTKITPTTIVDIFENQTLYAHWGGSSTLTLPSVTKSNYVCSWNTSADGTGTSYDSEGIYSLNEDVTLYVICSPNTYNVTFDPNGGTVSIPSKVVTYDSTYGELPIPTKSYQMTYNANSTGATLGATSATSAITFDGWYTNVSSGTQVTDTTIVNIFENQTLYAHWLGATTLTLPTVSKTNHVCSWNTSANGSGDSYNSGDSYTPNADTVLYAICVNSVAPVASISSTSNLKVNSQTATLSCTDDVGVTSYYWGTSAPTASSSYTSVDSTTSMSITKTVSSAGTYHLACKDSAGNVSTTVNKIYYNYTVNNMFQKTTGTAGIYTTTHYSTYSTNSYIAPSGTSLTLSSIYTIPTGATALTFRGVATRAASTTAATLYTTARTLDSTSTYSMWFDRETYTISYDANGGTGAPASQTKIYGVNLTLTVDEPTRDGFDFLGWSTSSTASTATYEPGESFTTNADTHLYAVWEESGTRLSTVDVGSYVTFTGNNGCSGNACSGQNANYVNSSNMGYCGSSSATYDYSGWRVAYIANNTAYLVSAGALECVDSLTDYELMAEALRDQLDVLALKYCNSTYAYGGTCNSSSAWAFDENDFYPITGSQIYDCSGLGLSSQCGSTNNLINNGGNYWYGALPSDYSLDETITYIYAWLNGTGVDSVLSFDTLDSPFGLRPVLRLASTVKVTGGLGTASSPYTLSAS